MNTAKSKIGVLSIVTVAVIAIAFQIRSRAHAQVNFENVVAATGLAVEAYVDDAGKLPENFDEISPFYARRDIPGSRIPEDCVVTFNFNKGESFLTVYMTCGSRTIRGSVVLSSEVNKLVEMQL